ncbi:CRP1 [Sanghuangporus weigelae]
MADTYTLTFNWPHTDAHSVIVTGTFDNWSSSVHLQRSESGFTGSVAVPWDTKVLYKFIVNGNWVTHPSQPTETDAAGFVNNVVHAPTKPAPPPVPADSDRKEAAEPVAAATEEPKKEVVEEEQPKKIGNVGVAPSVPVPIQPVLDGTSTDTTPESKPVTAETVVSTHEAAPAPNAAPEPTPVAGSSTNALEPSTPPQKKSDLPESSPAPAPVTPIKANGTSAPGHIRTSTGTSTPPSSLAPSTPKTSTTFPTIEGDGSPGSRSSSFGRKPRTSLFGRLKGVFRSPSKDKGKKVDSRSASPSSRK